METTTKTIRAAIKAIDSEATVSAIRDEPGMFVVRTPYKLDAVRACLSTLGLKEWSFDIEGSRFNWINVIHVSL